MSLPRQPQLLILTCFVIASFCYIDQATKLITSIELFRLKDGDYQKTGTIEYFDYNQPIAASVFALNIPADAIVVDQTSQEVGLLQGNLTEKEIAVEVVRQFFEAMIAKDYAKASPLYEGIPAEKLEKEFFPKLKIVKIVSIGEPVPSILTGGYKVPCVLEIEENGKIKAVVAIRAFRKAGTWPAGTLDDLRRNLTDAFSEARPGDFPLGLFCAL